VVLLWIGVWMHDRRHAGVWHSSIRDHLQADGGRFGFAALAFFEFDWLGIYPDA
jgi:high-affinity iron transporter